MKNIEFCKEYGYLYSPYNNEGFKIMEPYEYQEDFLEKLEDKEYITALASRQMDLSSMLAIHIANWLINNKTDRKIIYLMSGNLKQGMLLIDRIRYIIGYYNDKNDLKSFSTNNKSEIQLYNDNCVTLISNSRNSRIKTKFQESNDIDNKKELPYAFIVDNAAFVDHLKMDVEFFRNSTNVKQIILCSAFNNKINDFYDDYYTLKRVEKDFIRLTYKWDLNPNFTQEWYDNIIKSLGEKHKSEVDLVRNEQLIKELEEKNKSIVKTFRMEGDFLNKTSQRLLQLDKNWSDYVRDLINKDLEKK